MTADLVSLTIIAMIALACPIISKLAPENWLPETVLLLVAGAVFGPYMLGFITPEEPIALLSDLGLAFLFLLAGYELEPKELASDQGKHSLITWVVSFVIALLIFRIAFGIPWWNMGGIAEAIALTTTALGALIPIMKERNLLGTRVGTGVMAYGTWGELGPIMAMALLLSSRSGWQTIGIVLLFAAIAGGTAWWLGNAKRANARVFRFIRNNADTPSQTMVRATVLLLIGLVTISALFDLDIVLGAFAAGFALRYIIPEGEAKLETKLNGMAYGFFIPLFFVVSGMKINLFAVLEQPLLLIGFIGLLLLVRTLPIFVSLSLGKQTRDISPHNRLSISLYCTTALPLIVAVTTIAVNNGAMEQSTASVLVAAGAVTVFLMPLLASMVYHVVDAEPVVAIKEIYHSPRDARTILHEHLELERELARQDAEIRLKKRQQERLCALGVVKGHAAALANEEGWEEAAANLQRTSARRRVREELADAAAQEHSARRARIENERNAAIKSRRDRIRSQGETLAEHRERIAREAILRLNQRLAEQGEESALEEDLDFGSREQ